MNNELKSAFEKVGGWGLIKQYRKAGVLFYAIFQILLTGTSKKSLEIVRLGVQLKIKNKLKKRFKETLDNFDKQYEVESQTTSERFVWVCWLQGIENSPLLVQKCYEILKRNITDRKIILITQDNISQYVSFPDYIMEKYREGIISHTHFSDLLRVELLYKYGGTWIDSTVLCTGGNIPRYMMDSELFFFQNLKPGCNGASTNISNWFISAVPHNRLIAALRTLLYEYWRRYDYLMDYFFFHLFMEILLERYPEEHKKIIKFPNSVPHILLLMMFEPFEADKYKAVTEMCPFHKLAYKRSQADLEKTDTYYQYILKL